MKIIKSIIYWIGGILHRIRKGGGHGIGYCKPTKHGCYFTFNGFQLYSIKKSDEFSVKMGRTLKKVG